jgi:glycosyltransferase involved in cell wall biosynthesis
VILGVDGQARKIVEEADAGIVIEPENSVALVEAIQRLAGNRDLCQQMGTRGREYIVRHFSRSQTADAYIHVLDAVREATRQQKPGAETPAQR